MRTFEVTITSCGRDFSYDITTDLNADELEQNARIEAEQSFTTIDAVSVKEIAAMDAVSLKEITITTQDAIDQILDSYELRKQGFKSRQEHLGFCQAIKTLFGADTFENVIVPAVKAEAAKIYPNL